MKILTKQFVQLPMLALATTASILASTVGAARAQEANRAILTPIARIFDCENEFECFLLQCSEVLR